MTTIFFLVLLLLLAKSPHKHHLQTCSLKGCRLCKCIHNWEPEVDIGGELEIWDFVDNEICIIVVAVDDEALSGVGLFFLLILLK